MWDNDYFNSVVDIARLRFNEEVPFVEFSSKEKIKYIESLC